MRGYTVLSDWKFIPELWCYSIFVPHNVLIFTFIITARLFIMLQHFPVESKGRRKKLIEVPATLHCNLFWITSFIGSIFFSSSFMFWTVCRSVMWQQYVSPVSWWDALWWGWHLFHFLLKLIQQSPIWLYIAQFKVWRLTNSCVFFRCALMHLIKWQILMFWTIRFWTFSTTRYVFDLYFISIWIHLTLLNWSSLHKFERH